MALVNRVKVTVSLPHDIAEWLQIQADKESRNKNKLVEKIIREYIEKVTKSVDK